jgi:hypothetical protein
VDNTIWKEKIAMLAAQGVQLAPGLTEAELLNTETTYQFRFPPDLRDLLHTRLPCSESFPDWRNGERGELQSRLDWPAENICFDVEHAGFWLPDWGPRPASLAEALRLVRDLVANAPKLIPIYAHRYLPDEPALPGNPVLSVYQTDIIYYGEDLGRYLDTEFAGLTHDILLKDVREIRFWSSLVANASA